MLGEGIEQDDVLDILSKLVDKSLVVAEASPGVEESCATGCWSPSASTARNASSRGERMPPETTCCFVSSSGREGRTGVEGSATGYVAQEA